MAMSDSTMPEGTDSVIDDAVDAAANAEPSSTQRDTNSKFDTLRQSALDGTSDFRTQAGEKAWAFADQGKARAGDALHSFARMVGDAAGQVDDKIGPQYGDYARKAADAVSGAAESLQSKSLEELVEDAKTAVRNSPAIAIGVAAALGFVVARLARSSVPTNEDENA